MVLFQTNRRDEGLVELRRTLAETPPKSPDELAQLATLLLLMGDVDNGVSHLESVLDSDALPRTRAQAHSWIGMVQLGRDELDAAVTSFESALSLDPDLIDARTRLEEAKQKLKDRSNL